MVSLVIGSLGLIVAVGVAVVQYRQNKSLSERMIGIEEARREDEVHRRKGAQLAAQIIFDVREGTDWLEIRNHGPAGAKNIVVEPIDDSFASTVGLRPIRILEPGGHQTFRFNVYEHPSRAADLRISYEDPTGVREEIVTSGFSKRNELASQTFLDKLRNRAR